MLAIGLVSSLVFADDWSSKTDSNGIEVYTREVEGSKYHAFRSRGVVPGTVEQVLAEVLDVERYGEWFPNTVTTKMLSREENVSIYYAVTDMPWPVVDRDAVYQYTVTREEDCIVITMVGLPDAHPEQQSIVRMTAAEGRWTLEPAERGTRVTWELHLEPGGAIAPWLANRAILGPPRSMIEALRARIRRKLQANATPP